MDGEDHSAFDSAAWSPGPTSVNTQPPTQDGIDADFSDALARVDSFISVSGSLLVSRESDYQCLVKELTDWACRLKRRDILQWLSSAAAAAAAAPVLDGLNSDERDRVTTAFAMPQRMDAPVIDHIEAVLWRCLRQDDALGPRAVLDTVLAQHRLIRSLLPQVPDALRRRLLSLYADFSGLAGWLSFDLNSPDAAHSYYETARTAAHEAHNTDLGALILCNLSQLATWRRRPRVGIDHAVAAQGWARQTNDLPLQAFSYDVAAHAYAMDGDARAALNAIDQARQTLAVADQQQPTLIHFYGSGQLASTESNCLLRLGQPGRAADVAELAMRTIDPSFVRNLAMVTLRLGDCRLQLTQPDIPGAAQAIGDAAQLATRNHSVRLARRLDRSWRRLSRWHDVPEVRSVRDRMVSYRLS